MPPDPTPRPPGGRPAPSGPSTPNAFGLQFESLCVRDLRVYAEAIDGTVFHYRDKTGLEADVVIVLADGWWALIEVKLGSC